MGQNKIPSIKKLKGLPKLGAGNLSKIDAALQMFAQFRPKNEEMDCRAAFHKIRAFAYERSMPRKYKFYQHEILALILPEYWDRIFSAMRLYMLSNLAAQEMDACQLLFAKLHRLKQHRDRFINAGGKDGQKTKR